MKQNAAAQDCWIVGQLAGIRLMERELAQAFKTRAARSNKDLRQGVAELNSWLNLVDEALKVPLSARVARQTPAIWKRPTF